MVINWYGEACFRIQSGEFVLLTDPFDSDSGLTPPRFKTALTLLTKTPRPIPYEVHESALVAGPGEYEIQGNQVSGFQLPGNGDAIHTAYTVHIEEMKLGFLGHASGTPSPDVMEALSGSDILFVPASGEPFLSGEGVAKIVKQINPKIVVASLFKIPGLKRKAGEVKELLGELDQKPTPEEKIVLKKKDLPTTMQVKVLSL